MRAQTHSGMGRSGPYTCRPHIIYADVHGFNGTRLWVKNAGDGAGIT
jgi:hypothetical protein